MSLHLNTYKGNGFSFSSCISLQFGCSIFWSCIQNFQNKIACDLFSRKARTYPKNCFILEVIKLTSVRKMEGRIGSSYENDGFMSRLSFLLERIHKPPFCPREKCCHFHSKVVFFFFFFVQRNDSFLQQ